MPDRAAHRHAVLAAAAAYTASVGGWVLLVATHPDRYWQQTDALVYRAAGRSLARNSAALYAHGYGPVGLPFTYPPFAALVFAAAGGLPFAAWQLLLAATSLAGVLVACRSAAALAGLDRHRGRAVALAVAAAGTWLEPVDLTLHFGQINLALLALVLADLALPDRYRGKGVAIGLAAGIKLTPLIFVGYLLLTRRTRAAVTALAGFAATLTAGFVLLPSASRVYWTGRFARPGDDPARLVDQSLHGLALRLLYGAPAAYPVWLVTAGLVLVAGLAAAGAAGRRGDQLLGVCLTGVTGLLVSPLSWTHHWVWVLPALVLAGTRAAPGRTTRRVTVPLLAALAVVALVGWWPLPVGLHGGLDPRVPWHPSGLLRLTRHDDGAELGWTGWQLVTGDGYVLAGLAFVLIAAIVLALRRPARQPHAGHHGDADSGDEANARDTAATRPGLFTVGAARAGGCPRHRCERPGPRPPRSRYLT